MAETTLRKRGKPGVDEVETPLDEENAEKVDPVESVIKPSAEAEPVAEGEGVEMLFPEDVNILVGSTMHKFKKGKQRVPRELKDHWYLKSCGAVETGA